MTFQRLRIVLSQTEAPGYEGMDRPGLGGCGKVPEPLLLRGFALEDLAPEDLVPWRALLMELNRFSRYELISRGPATGPEWEALGFDVGEKTPAAWSAIAHRAELLFTPREVERWERALNQHGLFGDQPTAEEFLARYLSCDDPDKGWTETGWDDNPMWYHVVPIYRLLDLPGQNQKSPPR